MMSFAGSNEVSSGDYIVFFFYVFVCIYLNIQQF